MSTAVTENQIEEVVYEALVRFGAEQDDITRSATWEELSIDSLDLAELAMVVDERFGVELRGADMAAIKTVDDAVKAIAERA